MRSHDLSKHNEATEASWEAARGATYGAVKWGLGTALLGGLGYAVSPIYRGLTLQFKVYVLFFFFFLSHPSSPFSLFFYFVKFSFHNLLCNYTIPTSLARPSKVLLTAIISPLFCFFFFFGSLLIAVIDTYKCREWYWEA
jgi:hypothetical protein